MAARSAEKLIKIALKAFTSGLTPVRMRLKISIGRVVAPAPAVKLAIKKSSMLRMNAKMHPETIPGINWGNRTLKNA